MAVSWVGFAMSFTLLSLSMLAVLAVGGTCADGGPYDIQTHCPGDTGWLTPLSIYMGLASVAIGFFVARGLGASLFLAAWPILFIGLSVNFLQAGFGMGGVEPVGLVLGLMFLIMGALPLVYLLRRHTNVMALFAGTSKIDGTSVAKVDLSWKRSPEADDEMRGLDGIDYLVLIPLWIVEVLFGIWVGMAWFGS